MSDTINPEGDLPPSLRDPYALLDHGLPDEVWQNADDSGPIPGWMTDVACWLPGGRFAVETRRGTVVAEMLDWICFKAGAAWVVKCVR